MSTEGSKTYRFGTNVAVLGMKTIALGFKTEVVGTQSKTSDVT